MSNRKNSTLKNWSINLLLLYLANNMLGGNILIKSFKKFSFIKKVLVISAIPTVLYAIISFGMGILSPEIGLRVNNLMTLYSYVRSVFSIFLMYVIYIGILGVVIRLLQK